MTARSTLLKILGTALIVAGAALLVLAIVQGDAEVALVVIIPVIYGTGLLPALAILLVFAGIVALFMSFVPTASPERERPHEENMDRKEDKKFGGVVLIGPIPIVFGSWKKLRGSWILIALSLLSLIILIIFLMALLR
jgi:uncharacterized protein (TIGR00304 family)